MIKPLTSTKILKYTAAVATMGAPAVYMIHFHDKLYTDPVAKKRMFNTQLGFWGGMSAGVYAVHKAYTKYRKNTPVVIASLAFMAFSSYLGVKLAKVINKALYPHKHNGHGHNHASNQPQQQLNQTQQIQKQQAVPVVSPAFDAFLKSYKA